MAGWNRVSTLEELNQFLWSVGGFHDGIIKEMHWVNRDSIDARLNMSPFLQSDARVLVQRQWANPSAVELYLEKVWKLAIDTADFIGGANATTVASPLSNSDRADLLVLTLEASKFTFERLLWRDASEWMGTEVRFGPFDSSVWKEFPTNS